MNLDPANAITTRNAPPRDLIHWVVMGAAGSGKSTVGAALAERLGCRFVDADDHHDRQSIEKMRAHLPLTDEDRRPWLLRLRALLAAEPAPPLVLACSALRRSYRELLGIDGRRVRLVYLKVPASVLRDRLEQRRGHFAGPALLRSQLDTLEEPSADEAWIVDGTASVDSIVEALTHETRTTI